MPCKPMFCMCGNFTLQQRYVIVLLSFIAILASYNHRSSLNLIITSMVRSKPPSNTTTHYCPRDPPQKKTIEGDVRDWDSVQQSIVKLSFFAGYVVAHLPAGYISDIYGGRWSMLGSIIVSTVCCAGAPLCVVFGDWPLLSVSRAIMGLAQGFTFPATSCLLARWVPKDQRSFLGSLTFSGVHVGTIMGTAVSGFIVQIFNSWPLVFYCWALLSGIWCAVAVLFLFSGPTTHPFVTDEEKAMLAEKIPAKVRKKVPWGKILSDIHVWAIMLGQIGHGWMYFTLSNDLPNYLKNVQGFDIKNNGLVSSLPFLMLAISSISSGFIADKLIARGISVLAVRRFSTVIGNIAASAILLVVPYLGCNRIAVVGVFSLSMFVKGPFYCGVRINHLDLTTHFAGILTALVNGSGAISGAITPYVVGIIATEHTINQWRLIFWINFAVSASLTTFYAIFTAGERAPWDTELDDAK